MDTKALRQKILDLAIRGKLVPQDPKDEPAAVLLERIRAEKQRMVKDGKLKPKDIKNDTVIFKGDDNLHYEKFQDGTVKCIEDEIPFELPEGWSWCRLFSLSIKIGAGSTPTGGAVVYTTSGIKFIRSQNVYDDGLLLDDVAYIPEEINQKKSGSIVKSKDILLNITGGSIGRCSLVSDDFDVANVNQHVMIIRLANLELRKYIHSVVISPYIQEQIISRQVGSGRGGLSAETLSTFLIPLPPLNEQVSINRKLNECISQVLAIADAKCNISNLIIATKSKILDLAIRGKLVPQDPNDEPASVLLERIRSEKEELIKQGKIKRDKKESVIFKGDDNSYYEKIGNDVTCIDDEISFDIPDTWSWTRISTITDITMGSSPKSQDICNDNQYIEFHQGKIYFSKKTLMKSNQYTRKTTKLAPKQSVLLCVRAPVGELNITDRDICIGRGLASIKSLGNINEEFIFYWLHPYKTYLVNQSTGSTFSAITSDTVRKILIPLPPLMEQKEILDKIQKVFTLFENLETVN